jgi:hypothetical protein
MNKAEWYADRILWRARKLPLDDYLWSSFGISKPKEAQAILQTIAESEVPLVVFWQNSEKWTLLTNQYLRGRLNGGFVSISLDDVSDVAAANENNVPPNEFKTEAECVVVGKDRSIFWTPRGAPHFSLRNILRVFPLRPAQT